MALLTFDDVHNYADAPSTAVFRQTLINKVDEQAPTGVTIVKDFFTGPTVRGYTFDGPCYDKL